MQAKQSFAERFPSYMSPEGLEVVRQAAQAMRERRGRTAETRAVVRAIEASLSRVEPDAELEPFVGSAS